MIKKRDIWCKSENLPKTILKWQDRGYRVVRITTDGDMKIVQFIDKSCED